MRADPGISMLYSADTAAGMPIYAVMFSLYGRSDTKTRHTERQLAGDKADLPLQSLASGRRGPGTLNSMIGASENAPGSPAALT